MSQQRIHAPELSDKLEWINTSRPLKLAELKGKVVLLDFWSYCCINCLHIQPDLKYLEKKYGDKIAIIGIHSPKFPHEKVSKNLQKAINRYYIHHPIANDPTLSMWRQYAIKAWPSVIFIDPEGYVLGVLRGEGRRKQLDELIAQHLEIAEKNGIQNTNPLPMEKKPEINGMLHFPGKILVTKGYLYISDTGRNRIVETNHYGRVMRIFGTGSPGLLDGDAENASFNEPQGLALVDNFLYVADRGNHAIRRINLRTNDVSTIAGTGKQGRSEVMNSASPQDVNLNSPWDLAYNSGHLYIAMAGLHQVWDLDLTSNRILLHSGSGREDLVDGAKTEAAFAQPSGLSAGEYGLFVADAESSSIRLIRHPDGYVTTLVGTGLFDFGDEDGSFSRAKLQHPLGVAFDPVKQVVWVADTYNNKIRKIDIRLKEITSVSISHELNEPGGICLFGNDLWVSNTNAHEIIRYNTLTGESEVIEINEVQF